MMKTSNRQVAKVRSEKVAACITCPICKKLFKDATSITECLHTFCRKCIYNKITEEELYSCPVCNIDLGCLPLEKLRADHSLQDIRTKIFSSIKRETTEPEPVPRVPLPARRKERSLSSLVSTPNVSSNTVMARRRKPAARKASTSRGTTFSTEDPIKKMDDCPESSSSPTNLSKIAQNKNQNSYATEFSKQQHMHNKGTAHIAEPLEGMNDLWKPLNCLVEAAGITRYNKSNSQGPVPKSSPSTMHDDDTHLPKAKVKGRCNKLKIHDDENGSIPAPSGSIKPRKMHGSRQLRAVAYEGESISAQAVIDAASNKCERRIDPIWFTLVASDNQEGNSPLPQIPSCYLMIKDVNLPVLYIKKYLAQKLDLNSEAEVEITLQGHPVLPTLRLHNLIDLWLQTAPTSDRIKTAVGSSAKDFVMVLCYGRKAEPC